MRRLTPMIMQLSYVTGLNRPVTYTFEGAVCPQSLEYEPSPFPSMYESHHMQTLSPLHTDRTDLEEVRQCARAIDRCAENCAACVANLRSLNCFLRRPDVRCSSLTRKPQKSPANASGYVSSSGEAGDLRNSILSSTQSTRSSSIRIVLHPWSLQASLG